MFAPTIAWDTQVHAALDHALETQRLQRISSALATPSLRTCLRVNTLRSRPAEVAQQLSRLLPDAAAPPYVHHAVPSAVIVPGTGPLQPDYGACGGREIVINRLAGEAVLKGAHVYATGLLAASKGIKEGDLVRVSIALEPRSGAWPGVNRGASLTPELDARLHGRHALCVGAGRVAAGRAGLFRMSGGLAVEMQQRVFTIPPVNGLLRGQLMPQALPSIVAAHALDPAPGSRVLDMCAAPGGKTTMLAQLMQDQGSVLALDRTAAKAQRVRDLAADLGLTCITALAADATQLWQRTSSSSSSSGGVGLSQEVQGAAQLGSFDHVLLDAPCSALGLRPRLLHDWTLPALEALAAYQRALLEAAVHMLRVGGSLVYCTCTFNPGENEANVRHVLDRWPGRMVLAEQPLVLGGPGLVGQRWLSAHEAALVQRFDPGGSGNNGDNNDDTIGFFIAKFNKQADCHSSAT